MYRCACLFSIILLLCALPGRTLAADTPYILVDAGNGAILDAHKADDRWYPASLTKLMTAYVTFRAIANGEMEDGSPVVISKAARQQPPSRMGYKQGVQLRIDNALKIVIVKSANDVSLALAEAVAGSVPEFVRRMNDEARRLGLNNTRFANSNGLHSPSQFTSARDMAILSIRLFEEFPQYADMFSAVAIRTGQNTHYSYNLLLERFSGANGMKTGFVCASGYNMVASARRNGRTLVAVVFGRDSQTDRAVAAAKLLDAGFRMTERSSGTVFNTPVGTSAKPRNMRPVLCTEAARKNRYDPGAGQAKLSSPYLSARKKSTHILSVRTGGIDAAASESITIAALSGIPVPTKRPDQENTQPFPAIGNLRTGRIALPTPRP